MTQPLEKLVPVLRPSLPALLVLDDAPANLPVGGGQNAVDRAHGGAAGLVKQVTDTRNELGVGIFGRNKPGLSLPGHAGRILDRGDSRKTPLSASGDDALVQRAL
jgi:hypothetical protein